MPDDFYPFVDSGEPTPDNSHINGPSAKEEDAGSAADEASYATRIAVYDDMLSTPRVIVIAPKDVRSYLEEITNTVYRCMKEQGGSISLMVIREIVENFIHAHFAEPIISVLDGGQTIRFADQGPGIEDKERAFEFGVTSADRSKKRYIRGTGAGFPMVQQYLENAGGAVSIEDNLGQGTVITVSLDPARVEEIERAASRGAAVRGGSPCGPNEGFAPAARGDSGYAMTGGPAAAGYGYPQPYQQQALQQPYQQQPYHQQYPQPYGYPSYPPAGYPQQYPGYPQAAPAFPQQPYPPAPTSMTAAMPQAVSQGHPYISERGMLALRFLLDHGTCGPTDLAGAFGSSVPTWSRELDALTTSGLVVKHGQKRILTDMGRMWIQEQ